MIAIDSTTPTHRVQILCDNPSKETWMRIDLLSPINATLVDKAFPNALIASATLRDTLSLKYAIDVLEQNNVPTSHPLWDLNHSDLWKR